LKTKCLHEVVYIEASLTGETEPLELIEERIRARLINLKERIFDGKDFEDIVVRIVKDVTKSPRCEFILAPYSINYVYDRYYDKASKVDIIYENPALDIVRCENYDVSIFSVRVLIETEDHWIILPLKIESVAVKRISG